MADGGNFFMMLLNDSLCGLYALKIPLLFNKTSSRIKDGERFVSLFLTSNPKERLGHEQGGGGSVLESDLKKNTHDRHVIDRSLANHFKGPIIYLFDGRFLSRHKESFFI